MGGERGGVGPVEVGRGSRPRARPFTGERRAGQRVRRSVQAARARRGRGARVVASPRAEARGVLAVDRRVGRLVRSADRLRGRRQPVAAPGRQGVDVPRRGQGAPREVGPARSRRASCRSTRRCSRRTGGPREFPLQLVPFRVMTLASGGTPLMPWLLEHLGVLDGSAWETWVEVGPETARERRGCSRVSACGSNRAAAGSRRLSACPRARSRASSTCRTASHSRSRGGANRTAPTRSRPSAGRSIR